jgi:sugar phosphate isomerase/epimerase
MTRRAFSGALAAAAVRGAAPAKLGIASTCFMSASYPKDTIAFLDRARALGAAGIQMQLTSLDPAYIKRLRDTAERNGLYVEAMAELPKQDASAFERAISAARDAGASVVRVGCLSGRRYENFATYDEWKRWVDQARDSVFRAVPVAERQKMPLAIENHKDWTAAELAAMVKQISSEYAGVCLDTGNNIALLDDPYEVVDALAPYTLATHFKDMAVAPDDEGFLLSEVVLGDGLLDLRRIVRTIRSARPRTNITLEMITRNPLRVPCLTTKYWATFPDRSGYVLARTLAMVRQNSAKPLPRIDGVSRDALAQLEEENVRKCLARGVPE